MKLSILLLSFFSISSLSFSQCWNLRDESVGHILALYEKSDFDSIEVALERWRNTCEMNEELFRLSILSALQQGNSIDLLLDNHALGYLRSYETKKMESFLPYYHAPSFSDSQLGEKLDEATTRWAKGLANENELELLFLDIYSTSSSSIAWELLKKGSFPSGPIQAAFDRIVASSEEVNSPLMVGIGGFYDLRGLEVFAPQYEFGFLLFEKGRFKGYRVGYRSGVAKEFQVEYNNRPNNITSSSLFFAFDWGFKEITDNLFAYVSLSHTTYLSEYFGEEPGSRKKFVSSFGLGAGVALYPMESNKLGFNIELMPLSLETNKDLSMRMLPLSFGVKYLFGSNEPKFLGPIGYYEK